MLRLFASVMLSCGAAVSLDRAAPYSVVVSDERSGELTLIDGARHAVTSTIAVGKRPRGVHVAADGRTAYVALSGSPRLGPGADPERARDMKADKSADGIGIVDLGSRRLLRKVSVGSDPEQFILSRDGTAAIVSNEDEASASAWDLATGRRLFQTKVTAEPEGVALHPTRGEIYVTCEEQGDLFILEAASGAVVAQLALGGRPRSVAFNRDGATAYVPLEAKAEIAVVDAARHVLVSRIPVTDRGAMPMSAVVSGDGDELFVTTGRGNTVAIIDLRTARQVGTIAVGQRPWGIALSPDGTKLYTANGASDDVSVIEVPSRRELTRVKVGAGPWGLAIAAAN